MTGTDLLADQKRMQGTVLKAGERLWRLDDSRRAGPGIAATVI